MLDFIFFSFRYRLGNNMFGEGGGHRIGERDWSIGFFFLGGGYLFGSCLYTHGLVGWWEWEKARYT